MNRRRVDLIEVLLVLGAVAVVAGVTYRAAIRPRLTSRALFASFTPTRLANCTLKRYGDPHDGGYLMCENLLGDAQAAYSYGIDGRDRWGCAVSERLRTPVHEYDCFNPTRPMCDRGSLQFHDECVAGQASTTDGRPYDTVPSQIARNGDSGKHLVVKMDVEGAEWDALLATPDAVLAMIDQLIVEFHGNDEARFRDTMEKLKRHFYLVHVHANNVGCFAATPPFTSWANEALLVNKRIGVAEASGGIPHLPNELDAPNDTSKPDCQPKF
jgi:hypothetical protein